MPGAASGRLVRGLPRCRGTVRWGRVRGARSAGAPERGEAELRPRGAGARSARALGRAQLVAVRVLRAAWVPGGCLRLTDRVLGGARGSIDRARIRTCGRVVGRRVAVRTRGGGETEVVDSIALKRDEGDHQVSGVAERRSQGAGGGASRVETVGEHMFATLDGGSDGTRVRLVPHRELQRPCGFSGNALQRGLQVGGSGSRRRPCPRA